MTVLTTISDLYGVSVDLKNDNFWTGNFTSGQVLTFSGSTNTQIFANTVGFCPGETAFDCHGRRIWAGAQCGAGNDPVFVFDANTFALIAGPIGTGGVMGPIVVNPVNGKLYVTASGVSEEVDPTTFTVTPTGFGMVLAGDAERQKLYATSGSNLQLINAVKDTVVKTISLGYTPGPQIAVNTGLRHVYLMNPAANTIEVWGAEAGSFAGRISLGTGNTPQGIAADSVRGRIYVVVNASDSYSVWVIEDLTSTRICGSLGGG